INLLGDSSITSTSQSAAFPQAFSALLTEMMGSTGAQISGPSAAPPVQVDTPSVSVNANESAGDNRPITATAPTSSGPPQPPAQWAMPSKPKDARPQAVPVAAMTHSNPHPLPARQDLVQQAITKTNTSLPSTLAQVTNLLVAPELKDVNVADLKETIVG